MKFLVFGDSFVKMFLHCTNVKFYKFKGKSIKGLVKEQDAERKKIQEVIRKTPTDVILFFFGQVDFNFVRYFKALNNESQIGEEVFEAYVKWVASLSKKCQIISIFPTPITKENVIWSLVSKATYLYEQVNSDNDTKVFEVHEQSDYIWKKWNGWIQKYCLKYKVQNINLFPDNKLKGQFFDVSSITPHLRYVPVLKLVKQYFDINFDAEKAQRIEKEYEGEKVERVKQSKMRQEERIQQNLLEDGEKIDSQKPFISRLHTKSEDAIDVEFEVKTQKSVKSQEKKLESSMKIGEITQQSTSQSIQETKSLTKQQISIMKLNQYLSNEEQIQCPLPSKQLYKQREKSPEKKKQNKQKKSSKKQEKKNKELQKQKQSKKQIEQQSQKLNEEEDESEPEDVLATFASLALKKKS